MRWPHFWQNLEPAGTAVRHLGHSSAHATATQTAASTMATSARFILGHCTRHRGRNPARAPVGCADHDRRADAGGFGANRSKNGIDSPTFSNCSRLV